MQSQRHLFQLPEDVHYLNGAYMSPLMTSVEEAGILGMQRKRNPGDISADDFFEDADLVRSLFAQLIHASPQQIAIIPSASYGLTTAISNLPTTTGDKILMVTDDFPSDHYAVTRWCGEHGKKLERVKPGENLKGRGEQWNRRILESIDRDTIAVIMSSIHWTDGTIFDLRTIGNGCNEVEAKLIVDGTQSVGAMPIDVSDCKIDALVCAAYKWLLGPYAIGLAYYGDTFSDGKPLEEAWVNRTNARNFSSLTQYTDEYTPGAGRHNVGEYGNFILIPMINRALEQIKAWGVEAIAAYASSLTDPLASFLMEHDFWVEEKNFRAAHLMGVGLPPHLDMDTVISQLKERKVFVSRRGQAIRISAHVYNVEEDIDILKATLLSEE